jgi:hypothetical protein
MACEAGTPHTASDRSIEDAAYVRSTDGQRPDVWRAVNSNISPAEILKKEAVHVK